MDREISEFVPRKSDKSAVWFKRALNNEKSLSEKQAIG